MKELQEGVVPKRKTRQPISTEPNTPGRVLARLKRTVSNQLGITNTVLKILIENWVRRKQRRGAKTISSDKTNAYSQLGRVEITNGMLFRFFEIIDCEEVEMSVKVKMPDGTIVEATEKIIFNREETLYVDTSGKKKERENENEQTTTK